MKPIAFVLSLFEILFVLRMARVFRERAVLPQLTILTIVIATLGSSLGIRMWFGDDSTWVWAPTLALAALPLPLFVFLERKTIADFRLRLPIFLDRWLLNLRLGNSVVVARERALAEENSALRALLEPVFGTRGGERAGHLLLSPSLRREFETVSREPFSALARLENLRRGVRKTAEFRRKSGQALRQTRLQSGVMLVLVFAFSIYTIARYGWAKTGDLVSLAILLSLAGVVTMHFLSSKKKWKV